LNLGGFIITRLRPLAVKLLAARIPAPADSLALLGVVLRQNDRGSATARINADLTVLPGDGNIFVSIETWLALPFRRVPDRNPAAA
jgi:hypothetical protein